MEPWIGLTTYGRNAQNEYTLFAQYAECVRRAGAVAVLLPPGELHAARWLDRLDGFVLTGGGDIDPALYCASPDSRIEGIDTERDRTELELLKHLLVRRPPMLAICRGMQWVNVALGGTLCAHRAGHRTDSGEPVAHEVRCEADSRLTRVLRGARCSPMSWHHQAVEQLGTGARVVATAPDGTVEAIEVGDYESLCAVQWHPELTAAEDRQQQRLFDDLVAQARSWNRPVVGDPLTSVGF